MRKIALSLGVAVFFLASVLDLRAGTLAGVTLPDTASVGNKVLVLNGLGLRTKFMFKIYVAGLYLEQKSSNADAILKSDSAKRIVMKFLHDASKKQIEDAFEESFDGNAPDAKKTMKPEIDRLLGALDAVKVGDQMVFTYLPGIGTSLSINDQEKVTIATPAFGPVLFSVWLGPKPPNADLKKGLLGM